MAQTRKGEKRHNDEAEMDRQVQLLRDDPEWIAISGQDTPSKEEKKRVIVKVVANNSPNMMVTNQELYKIVEMAGLQNAVGTGNYQASLRNTLQESCGVVGFSRNSTIDNLSQRHPVSASLRTQRSKRSRTKYLVNPIRGVFIVVNSEQKMNVIMNQAAIVERQQA